MRPKEFAHTLEQLGSHKIRLFLCQVHELRLIKQDPAADDLVDPCRINILLAQGIRQLIHIAAGREIVRRALK